MTKTETALLFKIITNTYDRFEVTEDKVAIWHEVLKDFDFVKAQKNLREHIMHSPFSPTPSDIIRLDIQSNVPNAQQTREMLKQYEQKSINAVKREDSIRGVLSDGQANTFGRD